ncbi:response regulator [Bradyrhizobium sp. TZ2]
MAHAIDVISDSDPWVREALTGALSSAGYIPQPFQVADEFSKPSHFSSSFLVAKMLLPVMIGLELYDRLAASGRAIATILLTGRLGDDHRARALRGGVSRYVSKLFSASELLARIYSTLSCPTVRRRQP